MQIKKIIKLGWFKKLFNNSREDEKGIKIASGNSFDESDLISEEFSRMIKLLTGIDFNVQKFSSSTTSNNSTSFIKPIIYGYTITIGPDGKQKIKEFGNIKLNHEKIPQKEFDHGYMNPNKLVYTNIPRNDYMDTYSTEKKFAIILEIPEGNKDELKIKSQNSLLDITLDKPPKKYHRTISLPKDVDIKTMNFRYNNGMLEITFNKKTIS